jgi:hypothetical protein
VGKNHDPDSRRCNVLLRLGWIHHFGAAPETLRQQVGEAGEALPCRGGGGKAAVEAGVDDEVGANDKGECPQGADGIAPRAGCSVARGVDQRLGEVPEFAAESEAVVQAFSEQIVVDGEGLTKLGASDGIVRLFGCAEVGVVMKLSQVAADEQNRGLGKAADVEVR